MANSVGKNTTIAAKGNGGPDAPQIHISQNEVIMPSPQDLAEYNKIDSSFAERFLVMTEKEQAAGHRDNQEKIKLARLKIILLSAATVISVASVSAVVIYTKPSPYTALSGYAAVAVVMGILARVLR